MSRPLSVVDETFAITNTHVLYSLIMFSSVTSQKSLIVHSIITSVTAPVNLFMGMSMFDEISLAEIAFITARLRAYGCPDMSLS